MMDTVAWIEEAHIERRAARARRLVRAGETDAALDLYASLVPEVHRMAPHRQLRLIGGYADLLRDEGVLAFERLRGLARRAESAYRLCSSAPPARRRQARRQIRRIQSALFGIMRGVGVGSAFGRSSLRRVRELEWVAGG
ncbi:MAG: hypothetical protein AAGE94_12455 [Acidobacteriota bacterium]